MTDPDRPRTTPEGHTPEEPRRSELGKLGTPGAGRTSEAPHSADAAHAERVESGEEHSRPGDNEHGHAEPRVGPVDWGAWAYATLGVVAGLLVVGLFWMASS